MIIRLCSMGPSLRATYRCDPGDRVVAVNYAADVLDIVPDVVCTGDWTTLAALRHRPSITLWTPPIIDRYLADGRLPGPWPDSVLHWDPHALPLKPVECNYSAVAAVTNAARLCAVLPNSHLHLHGVDLAGQRDAAGHLDDVGRTDGRWVLEADHLHRALSWLTARGIPWTRHQIPKTDSPSSTTTRPAA
jgi:hypothetical protein